MPEIYKNQNEWVITGVRKKMITASSRLGWHNFPIFRQVPWETVLRHSHMAGTQERLLMIICTVFFNLNYNINIMHYLNILWGWHISFKSFNILGEFPLKKEGCSLTIPTNHSPSLIDQSRLENIAGFDGLYGWQGLDISSASYLLLLLLLLSLIALSASLHLMFFF